MHNAEYWISKLKLEPHPEGGFFREVYRSSVIIENSCLPEGYQGNRNVATSIFYLLQYGEFSSLHRLKSDELWYFHFGQPLKIYMLNADGHLDIQIIGTDPDKDHHLQIVIPAGIIFGAEVAAENGYSLCGCMVSPGFDFSDFELMDKETLLGKYPEKQQIIKRLTR